jgi:hypothetical protein
MNDGRAVRVMKKPFTAVLQSSIGECTFDNRGPNAMPEIFEHHRLLPYRKRDHRSICVRRGGFVAVCVEKENTEGVLCRWNPLLRGLA